MARMRRGAGDAAPARPVVPLLGRVVLVRAVTALLWAAVAVGSTTGVVALASGDARATLRPVRTVQPAGQSAAAFAELYVATYLAAGEGQEHSLATFYPGDIDLDGVIPGTFYVARTVALATERIGPDYWGVTVGAEVLSAVRGGYERAGIHYFSVGVVEDGDSLAATSLPSQVARPPALELPALAGESLGFPDDGDPAVAALERFFDAYLAGAGEVERYVAPSSGIAAVVPSPFADTAVRRVGLNPVQDGYLARVELEALDGFKRAQILDYALVVKQRVGRFEVTRLLSAPLLSSQEQLASE